MKHLIILLVLSSFALGNCIWTESIKTAEKDPKVLQFHNICYNHKHYVGNLSKDFSGIYHIEAIAPLFGPNGVQNCDCKEIQKVQTKETQFQIIEVYGN